MSQYDQRQKLIKRNQELYSWNWFYLNSTDNLMVGRYPKMAKLVTDKQSGEIKKISIIPYLAYSERFKEDREKAFRLGLEIKANQAKLNKLYEN